MDQSAFNKLFKTDVPHILEKVFFSLDYESYKKCHEVCKAWNRLLSSQPNINKARKMLMENGQKLKKAKEEDNKNEFRRVLSMGMVDVNCEGKEKYLSWAVMRGHHTIVKELLDAGAAVNKRDLGGMTPLHFAIKKIDMAKLLLADGADPNKPDLVGRTPIHDAARFGEKEVVKFLIEKGAEVDKVDNRGWTPLRIALMSSNKEAGKMLLDLGADPTKPDNYGVTPKSYARQWGLHQWGHLDWFTMLTKNP